jgi:hypothetical protein
MSKYNNNDNKNFSDAKYFVPENHAGNSVLKKNMTSLSYHTPKYTFSQPIESTTSKKSTKTIAYQKKLNAQTAQEKYGHDDSIIQKRATTISKKIDWKKWLPNWVRPSAETEARRAAAQNMFNIARGKTADTTDSGTGRIPSTMPSSGSTGTTGGTGTSAGDISYTLPLDSKSPYYRAQQLLRQQASFDFNTRWAEHDGSIMPFMSKDQLYRNNMTAHDTLMESRRQRIKDGDTSIKIDDPVSPREANSLMNDFGTFKDEPKITATSPISPIPAPKSKTTRTARVREEMMLTEPEPIDFSGADLTPEEKAFMIQWTRPGGNQTLGPKTRKLFLMAARSNYSPEEVAALENILKNDKDFGAEDIFQDLSEKIYRDKVAPVVAERIQRERTKPSSTTETTTTTSSSTPVRRNIPPRDPDAILGVAPRRAGTSRNTYIEDMEDFDDLKLSRRSSKPISEFGVFDEPPPPRPIRATTTAIQRWEPKLPKFEVLPGRTKVNFPKPEVPQKEPRKPFSTKTRIGLGLLTAGTLGYIASEASKPKTYIPSATQPTGKYKLYGVNDMDDMGENASVPSWTMPAISRSNVHMRPLRYGPSSSEKTKQMNQLGDYMYVYSPGEPKEVNGRKRPLNTREQGEMWRFGGDLYNQDEMKNKGKLEWSGKWTPQTTKRLKPKK